MKNKIVVDANILFSALLKKENPYIKILINANCKFFAPKFVFVELFKHKDKIQKCSSLSEEELLELLEIVLERIEFISLKQIDKSTLQQGYELATIDSSDAPFIALSLFLNANLWTGDKKLCKYLKIKALIFV
jgi:predicted nucleic acid-binding protein